MFVNGLRMFFCRPSLIVAGCGGRITLRGDLRLARAEWLAGAFTARCVEGVGDVRDVCLLFGLALERMPLLFSLIANVGARCLNTDEERGRLDEFMEEPGSARAATARAVHCGQRSCAT